jgi:hypothetical protein
MRRFAKHKWTRYRNGRPQRCARCGAGRRGIDGRREYREPDASTWSTTNPPCFEREDKAC